MGSDLSVGMLGVDDADAVDAMPTVADVLVIIMSSTSRSENIMTHLLAFGCVCVCVSE